jgi:hypothetical protein
VRRKKPLRNTGDATTMRQHHMIRGLSPPKDCQLVHISRFCHFKYLTLHCYRPAYLISCINDGAEETSSSPTTKKLDLSTAEASSSILPGLL